MPSTSSKVSSGQFQNSASAATPPPALANTTSAPPHPPPAAAIRPQQLHPPLGPPVPHAAAEPPATAGHDDRLAVERELLQHSRPRFASHASPRASPSGGASPHSRS